MFSAAVVVIIEVSVDVDVSAVLVGVFQQQML